MSTVKAAEFRTCMDRVSKKFVQALPVIFFFLALFYAMLFLFGIRHVMIVSLVTVQFQVNHKKEQTVEKLFRLVILQFVLEVLAFAATWNLLFCILLNLLVPFWLIFTKTSQFNQLGYFSGLMTFTFLQLMPVGWKEFPEQLKAMGLGLTFFFIVTYFYTRKYRNGSVSFRTEQKGLALLGTVLKQQINGKETEQELGELFEIQESLYKEAYQKRGKKRIVSTDGKCRYLFALMFQRAIYYVSDQSFPYSCKDETERDFVLQSAAYMQIAAETEFWTSETDLLRIRKEGERLKNLAEGKEEKTYSFLRSFFRMFLIILDQFQEEEQQIMDETWKIPLSEKIRMRLHIYLKPDAFEMRFALRMSVILIIGMLYNMLVNAEHGYWLAMNAFLLLRPMYEDSRYRMKTRFIGTVAGCAITAVLLLFCHGTVSHFLIASIMVACMYTATPGTWIHALFVTCFALSMTTLAIGETTALELRIIYVTAAVLLVLVVNRFFFPTSLGTQFRYNFQLIFHMHHMYLRLMEDALRNPLDYWRICDAQIQYHLVHSQLKQYLKRLLVEELKASSFEYEKLLNISWRMVAEVEQMLFLVSQRRNRLRESRTISEYISYTDFVLNQIQEMLQLRKERKVADIQGMNYKRYVEEEPQLSDLMIRYAKNLSKMYGIVCRCY